MSIKSRKEAKEQKVAEAQQEPQSPVKPVEVGANKKSDKAPQTRQPADPTKFAPIDTGKPEEAKGKPAPAAEPTDDDLRALAKELAKSQLQMQKAQEQMALAQTQMANQVTEDHQILSDHEWRIRGIEGRLGMEKTSPFANPIANIPAPKKAEGETEAKGFTYATEPEPKAQPAPKVVQTASGKDIHVVTDDGVYVEMTNPGKYHLKVTVS